MRGPRKIASVHTDRGWETSVPERDAQIRRTYIAVVAHWSPMLELYQAEGCPHCEKVREKLTDIGLSYVTHNPRLADGEVCNPQSYDELLALGGRDQIPFLVDHLGERTLYESDDITAYLDETYGSASTDRRMREKTDDTMDRS